MKRLTATLLLFLSLVTSNAWSANDREADHLQLQAMLADIERGINSGNIDLMVKHIDEQAAVTWLNAEVSRGPEGVRSYFNRMVGNGTDAILSKYVTHPKISEPARFYGDIAVASGTTEEEFTPHRRGVFNFSSRWTTTMVKRDGQWKILTLNLNTNTFNNVLIQELERYVAYAGAGGFLAGAALVGALVLFRRRKAGRNT